MLYGSSDEAEIQISFPAPIIVPLMPEAWQPAKPNTERVQLKESPQSAPISGGDLDDDIPF